MNNKAFDNRLLLEQLILSVIVINKADIETVLSFAFALISKMMSENHFYLKVWQK